TDEAQNRWVATNRALYVLRPGATTFVRFDQHDGLHFTPDARGAAELNPAWSELYCNERPVPDRVDDCRGYGSTMSHGGGIYPGISEIVGGGPNEVFVGYHGTEPMLSDDEFATDLGDPGRHTGKVDRVKLNDDGTITVDRFDFVANGHGAKYWHDRSVLRLFYDHFAHPDTLYVGTNHGVTIVFPKRFRYPAPGEWFDLAYQEWMGDHLHARVCKGAPCDGSGRNQLMGDWRGLAVDLNGDLWHAGKWSAGRITWVDDPYLWFSRNGDAFEETFGDPYPVAPNDQGFENEPVFKVALEGDPVDLSAVTVCPDGRAWFASRTTWGIAVWRGRSFQTFSAREVGLGEDSVADLACLPDGRLAVAGFSTGVVLWDPATGARARVEGLPSERVVRLEVDRMVDPPALHVATRAGAAVLRALP
ncbi:MAG TPA: WD40 repeat domain-containing protein, partial [Anaeromyxobacteraceae bacterium]|nr:WD40 repeat domain-containing protein [Anaeromyxobacteraceae bacterium]